MLMTDTALQEEVNNFKIKVETIRKEISKTVIGQADMVTNLLEVIFSNGHVLVEGIPGIGKTLLVRTLSQITGCKFSRIQFTPDLLPTDILGLTTYEEGRGFYTVQGPIFANFVLADEINRSPPKVQSALLEVMQEKQVTIGKETFQIPLPFFVMATQNPVENLGTYKLPEAQTDRFLYKLQMNYPTMTEEQEILGQNITLRKFETFNLQPILDPEQILRAQELTKKIRLDKKIEKYIVRIIDCTRNPEKYKLENGKYIQYGASPRSSISMYIGAKSHALIKGRTYVTAQDIKDIAPNVLRHRILINFEGEAEEVNSETIIKEILDKVPII